MAATTLAKTVRYLPRGTRQYYFLTTAIDPTSPTRTELDAGTDVTGEMVDGGITGFSVSPSTVEAPDLGSLKTPKVSGPQSVDDASIAFYTSKTGDDVRTLFTDGDTGLIVIFPEGDHTGGKMDIWPITVQTDTLDQDTSKVGQTVVSFACDVPTKGVAIPTGP